MMPRPGKAADMVARRASYQSRSQRIAAPIDGIVRLEVSERLDLFIRIVVQNVWGKTGRAHGPSLVCKGAASRGVGNAVRLVVDDGLIARVETGVEPTVTDERHGSAIPGLPNVHSHAFQRAMAGLAEHGPADVAPRDDFWTWRETMYRFVDRLDPADVESVAAFAYAEMLETGFTRVGEFHYLHHDPDGRPYADPAELANRIIAGAASAGIGLTLLPSFYAHGNFGGLPPSPGQRRFVNDLDGFARIMEESRRAAAHQPGTIVGVAPHSLRAVTPDELREVVLLAGPGPVHIHVAEQVREVENCLAWSGRRPVEWLLDHQSVDSRWCLIHATHTLPSEKQGIASRGAIVGLCPITEANLGDGIFDAKTFTQAGGQFGVGTDSNVLIDAAGELRQLEYTQRLSALARNVLASERQFFDGPRVIRTCASRRFAGPWSSRKWAGNRSSR